MAVSSGISYPFRVNSAGGIAKVDESSKILSNLHALVKSSVNDRLVRKKVGTIGYKALFRSDVSLHASTVETLIFEAIVAWEPRVTGVRVKVYPDESNTDSMAIIEIYFIYRNTGDPATLKVAV